MLFSNIAHAMDRRHSHTRLFHARLANLQAASQQHAIPKELYGRVKRHYYYVWSCGSDTSKAILTDTTLSVDLRRQLAYCFYGHLLTQVPFLENADAHFIMQLCEFVEIEIFAAKDRIASAGDFGAELYFVAVGSVKIALPTEDFQTEGEVIKVLQEGSFFGELGLLFPDAQHKVDVIGLSAGWLLVVPRNTLENLCTEELLDTFRAVAVERLKKQPEMAAGMTVDVSSLGDTLKTGSLNVRAATPSEESDGFSDASSENSDDEKESDATPPVPPKIKRISFQVEGNADGASGGEVEVSKRSSRISKSSGQSSEDDDPCSNNEKCQALTLPTAGTPRKQGIAFADQARRRASNATAMMPRRMMALGGRRMSLSVPAFEQQNSSTVEANGAGHAARRVSMSMPGLGSSRRPSQDVSASFDQASLGHLLGALAKVEVGIAELSSSFDRRLGALEAQLAGGISSRSSLRRDASERGCSTGEDAPGPSLVGPSRAG
eukprot:TRINITY_DN26025_c0_g1_i1.p1 TRINITY_DN26025_c0_g1~~TRINITY_DN26025_c0_g1_i1.p1  ORF type:complete len:492 (+),score=102.24 TRINITY_DN26025_c0_g1_i1:1176-2651(+)